MVKPMADQSCSQTIPDAPPILSNVPGSFAWDVFHRRHPALVEQLRRTYPYAPDQDRALELLGQSSSGGVILPLDRHAPDHQIWEDWGHDYLYQRWIDVPFLWAESYFYRKLLEAVGYFGPGPWVGLDPFEPIKNAELDGTAFDGQLALLDRILARPADEQSLALLHASLWGNRADLGFSILAGAGTAMSDHAGLVTDDSPVLWSTLSVQPLGEVCLVADNAGRELVSDLMLIDHLLSSGYAATVRLHLKPHPYYVSDATTTDLIAILRRLIGASGKAADAGRRLWRALQTECLAVSTHPFFCAPLSYHHLPADLAAQFSSASLTIMKGDLNYRRLIGDCHWPATTPFACLTRYFPGPVAALRTLKSEVIAGLSEPVLSSLNSTSARWRTDGAHAVIQARP